jgi:hypothetical protein
MEIFREALQFHCQLEKICYHSSLSFILTAKPGSMHGSALGAPSPPEQLDSERPQTSSTISSKDYENNNDESP